MQGPNFYQEICDTSSATATENSSKFLSEDGSSELCVTSKRWTAGGYWFCARGNTEKMDEPVQMVACICYRCFNCDCLHRSCEDLTFGVFAVFCYGEMCKHPGEAVSSDPLSF